MNPDPTNAERARVLRAERRSRIVTIRKRVAAVSVATFIALFSTIYIQMAGGHDPALAHTKAKSSAASTSASSGSSGSTGTSTSTGSPSNSVPSPAPVTTSQS
jgi:hypothetical protein